MLGEGLKHPKGLFKREILCLAINILEYVFY